MTDLKANIQVVIDAVLSGKRFSAEEQQKMLELSRILMDMDRETRLGTGTVEGIMNELDDEMGGINY